MATQQSDSASLSRMRLRTLFPRIVIGRHPTGPTNSLTDVPGILVSVQSLHKPNTATPEPVPNSSSTTRTRHAIHTGVTTILPRKNWFNEGCYAGIFRFNGSGEMTGAHWIEETGLLHSPIIITNSFSVGSCYSGVYEYAVREYADKETGLANWFLLPIITETCDLFMSDIAAMPVTSDMVVKGIETANSNPVPEGNTGGGTGMLCQGFKGGTGCASRVIRGKIVVEGEDEKVVDYTVATLVQANYGAQWDLHIGRVPVGKLMMDDKTRAEKEKNLDPNPNLDIPEAKVDKGPRKDGSIIVIIATDAPLHPVQLQRLAKRATTGLARTSEGLGRTDCG